MDSRRVNKQNFEKEKMLKKIIPLFLVFAGMLSAINGQKTFDIRTDQLIAPIQPTMWGIFFEDINMGADGGLYAELVKNRSFEFFKPLMGWKITQKTFQEGAILVVNNPNKKQNPRNLKITLNNTAKGDLTLTNEGFRGMGIKKGIAYNFSFLYKTQQSGIKVYAEIVNEKNKVIGSVVTSPLIINSDWKKEAVSFVATDSALKGQLRISFEGTGIIEVDMISLFPSDTWKHRPGGLRADMVQMLADMKPGFIRFPGGCIVEGFDLSQRYQWKKTIGPVEDRQMLINRWNFEFAHRPAPDYFQSFGLGFFEYFQLAEDIGAEPLPILNCGMACQFNSAEVCVPDSVEKYIQDALDLVEFANGSIDSQWGRIRAEMGHPAPFHLKMIGVGNENWGPQYIERLQQFQRAIKVKYPDIKIVGSSGTDPNGDRFDYLNTELRKQKIDLIDEHYYRPPQWFFSNTTRYDHYPINGSKIFAGEYAAQSSGTARPDNRNNWLTALSEAAFMTGLERNAAVVHMASYAPLFAHVDGWQWTPDLIWIDNLHIYGTPNYYVQKLFSLNKGTDVIPIQYKYQPVTGQDSLFASAVIDATTKEIVIKIINASANTQKVQLHFSGNKRLTNEAIRYLLQSDDLDGVNSIENPQNITPVEQHIKINVKKPEVVLPQYSFSVLRFPYK